MAKSNEVTTETTPLEPSPIIKPQKTSGPKNNALLIGFTLILAIAALATALYTCEQSQQLQKKLRQDNANLLAQVDQLKHEQNNRLQEIDTKTNNSQQSQQALQDKIDHLDQQMSSSLGQRFFQTQDWLLLKVRYCLELAQINTHWSNDFDTSAALMQQADTLLKQLNGPQIFAIRQALAEEISQLKAIPNIDVAGVLSQLDAAQNSISNLPIHATLDDRASKAKEVLPKAANPSSWRSRLQDNVHLLEQFVVIRRNDEPIQPLMSPFFESILRESIQLNLQQAQWAVLNNNASVFQSALKQAITNLKRTFNEEAQSTVAVIKQLTELQKTQLTQEKPVIELALPLLNQFIDHREVQLNQINNSEKGEKQP
ncbi:MAG: uroporphyrinogen-III C-methyltransferase [Legionellales bacterium]